MEGWERGVEESGTYSGVFGGVHVWLMGGVKDACDSSMGRHVMLDSRHSTNIGLSEEFAIFVELY